MTAPNLVCARRVSDIPPYPFASLAQTISKLTAGGADVIRLDIGNPDLPPAPFIIDALVESSRRDDTHGYGGYAGSPEFRGAIASYYQNRFGVTLNPETEVRPLLGSKEGLANINLAWLDPGDLALIPDPGYITYGNGPILSNSQVATMPLKAENNWLPDFSAIPVAQAEKARLMWLNYPNNPTGAPADLAFFEEAIAFCRKYDILLCHDNPYCEVTYDGYEAVSPLQVPGAKDVVIEFNSLSKTYNLAGWRIGMVVGNPVAVKALAITKTQIDTGLAIPVQQMAVAALTGDQSWLKDRNRVYQERRDIAVAALRQMGLDVTAPKATLYLWFPPPAGYTDVEFHKKLLNEAHLSIAPGSIYGEEGVNWMRLSVSTPTERLKEGLDRLKKMVV